MGWYSTLRSVFCIWCPCKMKSVLSFPAAPESSGLENEAVVLSWSNVISALPSNVGMRWQQSPGKEESGDFSLNYSLPTRFVLICCIKYSKVLDLIQNQNQTLKLDKHPGTNCQASSEFSAPEVRARELLRCKVMSRAGYGLHKFTRTVVAGVCSCAWFMPEAAGWCVAVRVEEGRKRGGRGNVDGTANHKKTSFWSLGVRKEYFTVKGWERGKLSSWTICKLNYRTPKKQA